MFSVVLFEEKTVRRAWDAEKNLSVNRARTLRNWPIGAHIHHFKFHGSDRAIYGAQLLDRLVESLSNLSSCNKRQIYRYLQFYRVYSGVVDTAFPQFSLPGKAHVFETSAADFQIVGAASPHSWIPAEFLLSKCTYSHIELVVEVGDSLKRAFYEIERLRGNWSVRELLPPDRQPIRFYTHSSHF